MRTYAHNIKAIPSMNYWDEVEADPIHPPAVRRQPGRPKKMRRREADEPRATSTRRGLTVHCKRCFQPGHNSRSCRNAIHPKSKFYKVLYFFCTFINYLHALPVVLRLICHLYYSRPQMVVNHNPILLNKVSHHRPCPNQRLQKRFNEETEVQTPTLNLL